MTPTARALIFDLDGTLLDTLQDIADAVNAGLAAYAFTPHPVEAYRTFVGDGVECLIQRACPQHATEEQRAKVLRVMREQYQAGWARHTRPYPGIEDMLSTLAQKKLPMAVLSNKPHEFTVVMVQHFFPSVPFFMVQGSPPGRKAKPEPDMALALARQMNLAPANIFFMGDSNVDMLTARAAGMTAAGATWGFRTARELTETGATVLLHNPADIFAYI